MKAPKRLHYWCLLAVFLCIALQGYTQEKTITGRVVDVSNSPLVGVTVTIKNKNTATRTNDLAETLSVFQSNKSTGRLAK
jgi:hypothetical protein